MSEEEKKVEGAEEPAAEEVVEEVAVEEPAAEAGATEAAAAEEEAKAEAAAEEPATDAAEATDAAPKKKGKKKWPVVVGIVAVVLIAAGAGFWVWHEQPSFCNAICHVPMDPYLPTYEAEPGQPATDKWGNEVEDASGMMAAVHRVQGDTCMSCHVPTIGEQVSEGMAWVSGNYIYPLDERNLEELVEARGLENEDEFCLNEACHNLTRDDLIAATSELGGNYNPHEPQHGQQQCSTCHKAHRASVNQCTQCHSDAVVPDGWLTAQQAGKLEP